jgi:hypothetical protein
MPAHPLYPFLLAFQTLRRIDWISPVTLVADAGDLRQFALPTALMAFVGLVPSESSSGGTQRRGHIAKTGNVHLRRVLVESAHSYRFRPILQGAVKRRLAAVPDGEPALRQLVGVPKIGSMTACAASARRGAITRPIRPSGANCAGILVYLGSRRMAAGHAVHGSGFHLPSGGGGRPRVTL